MERDPIQVVLDPESAAADVGRALKQMRTVAGLSQRVLGGQIGLTHTAIAHLEKARPGRRPPIDVIARFAQACGYQAQLVLVDPATTNVTATLNAQSLFDALVGGLREGRQSSETLITKAPAIHSTDQRSPRVENENPSSDRFRLPRT